MGRYLYILISFFILACEQPGQDADFNEFDPEVLSAYNEGFREQSLTYYTRIEKLKTTIKAQGGGNVDFPAFALLKSLIDETNAFMEMRLINIEVLGEKRFKKIDVQCEIFRTLEDLKSFAAFDIVHNSLKKNEKIDYQRNYSEAELEEEITGYINRLQRSYDEVDDMLTKEQAEELIINGQSLLYLAERKVLVFLNESYDYGLTFDPLKTSNIRTEYTGLTYQPGEKINLVVQPLLLYEIELLSHDYRVFYEGTSTDYEIKGALKPGIDTLWLPTDKIGNYRVEGESVLFGRVARTYNWEYEYKVIAP